MGDGLRSICVVTTDETLIASARAASSTLGGWEVRAVSEVDEILSNPPTPGDVILLDNWLRSSNVYEACRKLGGRTRCRTYVVLEHANELGEPIARFCGATGVLWRPLTPSAFEAALEEAANPLPALPSDGRGPGESDSDSLLPEMLLTDVAGKTDRNLVQALTDPETSLFNYAFLNYKLDEEFKRSKRFDQPLACLMLGFEGQATEEILRELSGIILVASRDTDILGRFDENTFLFLLPHTGPDGAEIMAQRLRDLAEERQLVDLVGDPLAISVGISNYPHEEIDRREELFGRARDAFFAARADGGGVVTTV